MNGQRRIDRNMDEQTSTEADGNHWHGGTQAQLKVLNYRESDVGRGEVN